MSARQVLQAFALALLLAPACSGGGQAPQSRPSATHQAQPTPTATGPSQGELQLVASGTGTDSAQTAAGVVVKNSSARMAALQITIEVTARDQAGQVLGSGNQQVSFLRAGEQTGVYVNGVAPAKAPVAKLDTVVAAQVWLTDPHPSAVLVGRGAHMDRSWADAQNSLSHTADANIVGEIQSRYQTATMQDVSAYAICYQGARVIGAASQVVPLLPAGGSVGVTAPAVLSAPPDRCDLYAVPAGGSRFSSQALEIY